MHDDVDLPHQLLDERVVHHRPGSKLDRVRTVRLQEMLDVRATAGREVVQQEDRIAPGDECIRDVRADEARPAGDQISGHVVNVLGELGPAVPGRLLQKATVRARGEGAQHLASNSARPRTPIAAPSASP